MTTRSGEMSLTRAALVLLAFLCAVPDLCLFRHRHHAMATSLELVLSSDVTDDDIRVYQEDSQVVRFNYTLNVTGDSNHTLALAVCATVDDSSIARAEVSEAAIVPLHSDLTGAFNVTVRGVFLGRADLHVHFVVGHRDVECGQPEARSLQELLKVSEGSRGKELALNVSRTSPALPAAKTTTSSPSSSSSSSPSSLLGVHSGRTYTVIVLRQLRAVDTLFTVGVVILVAVINVGMGSKLDLQVVKDTLRRPFAPVTGLCSQFIIMPLLAYGVTQAFQLEPGIALGFFAMGCSPGGSISNAFCYLLGGDVSLSITMTFISTIAALGLVPLWLFTLGRYVSGIDKISIPFGNIAYSLLGLLAAVGAGLFLKVKKPRWARIAITASKVSVVVMIVFMSTVGVYANLYIFQLMRGPVLAAAALLPYAGFLLGGLVALVLRMSTKHVVTIAVETGIQNGGIAILLLLLSLDHPESDRSIVAPVTSTLFTPIPLWIAVAVVKIRQHCFTKRSTPSNAATTTPEVGTGRDSQEVNSSAGQSLWKKLCGKGEAEKAGCGYMCRVCLSGLTASETERKRKEEEEEEEGGVEQEEEIRRDVPLPSTAGRPVSLSSERNGTVAVAEREAGGFDNLALDLELDDTDVRKLGDLVAEDRADSGGDRTERRVSFPTGVDLPVDRGTATATVKVDHSTATGQLLSQAQALVSLRCPTPPGLEISESSSGHETYV